MKKFISVLLALAMVLSLVPTVFAANEPNFSLEADKTSAAPGESVTLTLKVDSDVSVGSAGIKITFDTTAYTLVSATGNLGTQMSQMFTPVTTANKNGSVKMTTLLVGTNGTWNAGTIATYTFTAKEGADAATAKFTLNVEDLAVYGDDLSTLEDVAHTVVGGELTIPVKTPEAKGYTVTMGADKTVVSGAQVEIPVTIDNTDGKTTYNAYDMTFSYDTSVLKLDMEAESTAGSSVIPGSGTVRVIRYGKTAKLGEALKLKFTVIGKDNAEVKVTAAKVDISENALTEDAPDAIIMKETTVITFGGYTVTLPDGFTRTDAEDSVIKAGGTLTFKPTDPNYDYTVTVTVGGETVTPTVGENGTYTVANVNGNVNVTSTKTPKTFNVTLGADTTGKTTATYTEDYTFTLKPNSDYTYSVTVTIGGKTYTNFASQPNSDGTITYTIPGADITGNIVIDSGKTVKKDHGVSIGGSGSGSASGNPSSVKDGNDYTFTVVKEEGYTYTISATMDGKNVEVILNEDGTYTIKNVTGELKITITKQSISGPVVAVSKYVEMNNKTVFLVTVTGTPDEGKAFAYDGNVMYKTTAYGKNVYSWLVIVDTDAELTVDTAKGNVTQASATAEELTPSYDVNETNTVDINDAQLTYDIYSGKYTDFEKVSVRKFLRADVNGDGSVNSTDAVAVVANSN